MSNFKRTHPLSIFSLRKHNIFNMFQTELPFFHSVYRESIASTPEQIQFRKDYGLKIEYKWHERNKLIVCNFCGDILFARYYLSHLKHLFDTNFSECIGEDNYWDRAKKLEELYEEHEKKKEKILLEYKKIEQEKKDKEKLYNSTPKEWKEINVTCKNSLFYEGDMFR